MNERRDNLMDGVVSIAIKHSGPQGQRTILLVDEKTSVIASAYDTTWGQPL